MAPVVEQSQVFWGTGRRKAAIARVRVLPGDGKLLVNGREVDDYFPELKDQQAVRSPIEAVDGFTGWDVLAHAKGGGLTGQADAVKLGIARAIVKAEPALEEALREGSFLTRDPRMKERKKYGRRGARRSFQFSKR